MSEKYTECCESEIEEGEFYGKCEICKETICYNCKDSHNEKNHNIKETIWIIKNKNYIVNELKNLILDVEDEHYSTPRFFASIENRLNKWKQQWELEKDR